MSSASIQTRDLQQLLLRLPNKLAEQIRKGDGNFSKFEVKPDDSEINENFFIFQVGDGDETYPAMLSNLPCNIETHKTFDMSTFYKSCDIGQVKSL